MPSEARSANSWVQTLQALVAVELVERMGIPGRRAAEHLGVAPSAISQYLSGRRLARTLPPGLSTSEATRLAHAVARRILEGGPQGTPGPQVLLEAAATSWRPAGATGSGGASSGRADAEPRAERGRRQQLRARIRSEQAAVADCMHLAQKARDELTRAIFRQIASDSLRHAEIVASLASYADRGMERTLASGISPADIRRLIERERQAEKNGQAFLSSTTEGTMALLAASIAADERKHDQLLEGLLEHGFGERASTARKRPRAP